MVICPHNFSVGAHGLMVVFLKHLLAMVAAGFCSGVHTVPWTFIPSKAGPCLLCAPTDSLAHVCLSALCNCFVRVVRVHVFRVQAIASNVAVSAWWPEFAHIPHLVIWHKMKT